LGSQNISGVQGNEGDNAQKKKKQEIYCPEENGSFFTLMQLCP
jgi:hypothetical protein